MSNEAFDIWLKENYLVDMSEFIVDEQERTYIKENNLLRKAWQAAKADSESILQEQQNTIVELEINYNMLFGDFLELQAINNELSASINVLREALNAMRDTFDIGGDVTSVENNALYKADKALASTPAQSLQAHDDEVIEMVVTLLKDSAWGDGIIDMRVSDLIEDVRALKG